MKKSQLLNEIMGVPKAVDFWVDYFSYIITGLAKGIVSKDEIESSEMGYTNKEGDEVTSEIYRGRTQIDGKQFMNWVLKIGGYNDLKELLEDPRFKQFPLYNPTLKLTLFFVPTETLEIERGGRSDLNFVEAHHGFDSTKNALSKIGNNEIFVNQQFGFEVYLPSENLDNLNTESLRKQIKSTISHELTHAYEGYHRIKTTGDPHHGRETFLNAAVRLMSDDKYPQWRQFLHLIYLHLGFEINARVTQFYYNIKDKDIKTTDDFVRELKKSSAWAELQMLENFDADKFIKSFSSRGLSFMDIINDIGKQMDRQRQGLPPIELKITPEESMKHLIQGWDYVLQRLNIQINSSGTYKGKLMDLVPTRAMEDPYVFFKFFEKRFHKKAKTFKKKLYRIGSLVIDKSLIGESTEEFDWVGPEINQADEFIFNKFKECELKPVEKKDWEGWTKYIDKNGKILFLDDIETGTKTPVLYFDYREIYLKLEKMGLKYSEIKKLCIDMLYETHKRKVLTTGGRACLQAF